MNLQHKIIQVIKQRQLKWFGFLKRFKSNKISKMILEWNSESRRRKRKTLRTVDELIKKKHDQQ